MTSPLLVCGIDPGLDGGLTILNSNREVVASIIMPTLPLGKKRILESVRIVQFLEEHRPHHILLEKVASRPDQSAQSVFTFGYGAGILEGVVAALRIPYTHIIPQTWMKKVFVGMPKEGNKTSIIFCQQKWPSVDWRANPRCRVPHDGRTDSACIALSYFL